MRLSIDTVLFILLLLLLGGGCAEKKIAPKPTPASLPDNDIVPLETEIPNYLLSQLGIFLTVNSTEWASASMLITSIELIDFNGDSELIFTSANPLALELTSLYLPKLLVYSQSVFASEYERLRITFDLSESRVVKKGQEAMPALPVVNILNYGYGEKTFVAEVGLNNDASFALTADSPAYIHIALNLDHSFKALSEPDRKAWIFRPALSMKTNAAPPPYFQLTSTSTAFDPVSQKVTFQLIDRNPSLFKTPEVDASKAKGVNLFGFQNEINRLPGKINARGLAFINATEKNWTLDLLSAFSAPLTWITHQGSLSAEFESNSHTDSIHTEWYPIWPFEHLSDAITILPNQQAFQSVEDNRSVGWIMPVTTQVDIARVNNDVSCQWAIDVMPFFSQETLHSAC
ncbi:MAG: hypothetical protein OXE99_07715, partial [Cellvibrionales bacterium]|nr:hypothetical protein [Cellvibrionales bacterium]